MDFFPLVFDYYYYHYRHGKILVPCLDQNDSLWYSGLFFSYFIIIIIIIITDGEKNTCLMSGPERLLVIFNCCCWVYFSWMGGLVCHNNHFLQIQEYVWTIGSLTPLDGCCCMFQRWEDGCVRATTSYRYRRYVVSRTRHFWQQRRTMTTGWFASEYPPISTHVLCNTLQNMYSVAHIWITL